MKYNLLVVCIMVSLFTLIGVAQAEIFDLDLKQGAVICWEDDNIDNLSTFEMAKTKEVKDWPNWANALVSGWSLDGGLAYDATGIDTGAILIGREFGAIGKYLPIDFPLKDKFKLTVYPIGIMARGLSDLEDVDLELCSGGAIFDVGIKF